MMNVNICGIEFKNPVIAASGTFGFGREFAQYYNLSELGGIATKAVTPLVRLGNNTPRIAETPSGMLNAVGLQNPGLKAFLSDELPWLTQQNTRVIVNIAGSTLDDYKLMAKEIGKTNADMIELNISCPNVKEGGVAFGTDPAMVEEICALVRSQTAKPFMAKLTPNVTSITACAKAAERGGANAISLINTITGMAIDVKSRRPVLSNITGGLSGPAIRPVALRMCYEVYKAVSIPIIGMGGIETAEDAIMFLLAGASAVQVGSANLYDPYACVKIVKGIENYLKENGFAHVSELTGALKV